LAARRRSQKRRLFSEDTVATNSRTQTTFKDGNFSFQRLPSQRKRAIFPAFAVPTEMEEDAHEKNLRDFDLRAGAFGVAGAAQLYSQDKKEAADAHKIVHFGDLKWTPLIKGCDVAPVEGDMNAEGSPFVLRLRCADGSKIPAHWHPTMKTSPC